MWNPYEASAREVKAQKLADYLHFVIQVVNSEAARELSDFGWRIVAVGAGVHPPRAETRERVIRILAGRERITAQGLRLDPYFQSRTSAGLYVVASRAKEEEL